MRTRKKTKSEKNLTYFGVKVESIKKKKKQKTTTCPSPYIDKQFKNKSLKWIPKMYIEPQPEMK